LNASIGIQQRGKRQQVLRTGIRRDERGDPEQQGRHRYGQHDPQHEDLADDLPRALGLARDVAYAQERQPEVRRDREIQGDVDRQRRGAEVARAQPACRDGQCDEADRLRDEGGRAQCREPGEDAPDRHQPGCGGDRRATESYSVAVWSTIRSTRNSAS
jgi:hypothetical protein